MTNLETLIPPYLLYLGESTEVLEIKTARGLARWRPELCFGEFGNKKCTNSLGLKKLSMKDAANQGARTLVLGLANSGGQICKEWHKDIKEALSMGLNIASGLHAKLTDIPEFSELALKNNCALVDLRSTNSFVKTGSGKKRSGNRILTVGTDCSVGKMYTSLSITQAMQRKGFSVEFKATGQTGILIAGSGVCIDAVIADFMSGAVEELTPSIEPNHWQVIEGQGSLYNPSFAGVSTALLHGSQADLLVMCHEAGRNNIKDLEGYSIPSIEECLELNLRIASLTNPTVKLAGISLNTRNLNRVDANKKMMELQQQFGVPCFDPVATGTDSFVEELALKYRANS